MFFFQSPNEAILFLINSVLPFANACEPLQQAHALNVVFHQTSYIFKNQGDRPDFKQINLQNQLNNDLSKRLDEVVNTHDFIVSVMSQSLASMTILNDLVTRGKKSNYILQDVEQRIKDNLQSVAFKVLWRNKGACTISLEYDGSNAIKTSEMIMVCSITSVLCSMAVDSYPDGRNSSLKSFKNNTGLVYNLKPDFSNLDASDRLFKNEGLDKIGMCSNCGVFFEKKRKDQTFCSTNCKSVYLTRKMRRKTAK